LGLRNLNEVPFDQRSTLLEASIPRMGYGPGEAQRAGEEWKTRVMKRKPWNMGSLVLQGSFFGILVGTIFVMSEPFQPDFKMSEPLYRIFLEIIGSGAVGASLFAAAAWIHNWIFSA
jgi:hypothetical protein